MANNSFNDYSTTPALNSDIAGTSIAVGCPPADIGVYARTLLAQIAYNVQGTPGLFAATWHVGALIADSATITTFSATTFTATNLITAGSVTATSFIPTGAAVPSVGTYLLSANVLGFATNTTYRMQINGSGDLLYNTTQSNPITAGVVGLIMQAANNNVVINSSTTPLSLGHTSGASALIDFFAGPVSHVGSVSTDSFTTSYNTTSDQRLKVKVGRIEYLEAADVIERIAALWFCWKSGDSDVQPGFFAQQVHRVCPWAVTKGRGHFGSKNFVPWQMDASKLMPFVIAYIQGLGKRVADLERVRK